MALEYYISIVSKQIGNQTRTFKILLSILLELPFNAVHNDNAFALQSVLHMLFSSFQNPGIKGKPVFLRPS
jgi:hypothetical protein